jgi:hypothetical protein
LSNFIKEQKTEEKEVQKESVILLIKTDSKLFKIYEEILKDETLSFFHETILNEKLSPFDIWNVLKNNLSQEEVFKIFKRIKKLELILDEARKEVKEIEKIEFSNILNEEIIKDEEKEFLFKNDDEISFSAYFNKFFNKTQKEWGFTSEQTRFYIFLLISTGVIGGSYKLYNETEGFEKSPVPFFLTDEEFKTLKYFSKNPSDFLSLYLKKDLKNFSGGSKKNLINPLEELVKKNPTLQVGGTKKINLLKEVKKIDLLELNPFFPKKNIEAAKKDLIELEKDFSEFSKKNNFQKVEKNLKESSLDSLKKISKNFKK